MALDRSTDTPGGFQVRRRDEQEVVGLRARFRYPDGSLRWFDLPNDEVPSDPSLPVVALVAAGCAETTEVDDPILDASDSPKPQRGGSDVTVIVTDAKGSPIPAATIRASNSCFRGLELSGPLPISDRAGKVTLRAIPGGSHLILVLADGFMPEQRSIDLEGEGRVEVVVTLRPATTVDVEIVDENGKPLAFAPVSHRLAEAERTSMVACTSDSLGRLRLPWETGTDFELQACQIQESVNTPLGKLDMPLRFVCKRTPRILAHVSECGTLSWIEALRGDRLTFSASPQHPFAAPQCRTFLGSLPPETESTLLIHFESGPPARFQSNDFAAAQPDGTGFSVVERAKPVRRVPIAVTTSDGKAVE